MSDNDLNTAAMIERLQATMADDVGPLRTEAKLERALAAIDEMTDALGERPSATPGAFDMRRLEWFDLRNMLTGRARGDEGRARAQRKPRRAPARGFPRHAAGWRLNQVARLDSNGLVLTPVPAVTQAAAQ